MMQTQAPGRRNTRQQIIHATNTKVVEFQDQVDQYAGHLQQALPRHVSLDKFKRILVTAATTNPDLLLADRRTLMLAAIRCASDGLMPDGRQAALVVYNTEIKRRDPATGLDHKFRIDAVQYMPMIAGIRERMRNTGEVASADAHVVHERDKFHYDLGDNPFIEHEPAALNEEPGAIIGAYAIIKLKNGEILRDVMRKSEIEQTRAVSRAKDGPMWTKFYGEACRKTVLRRCSKAAPQTSDLDRLIGNDNDEEPVPPVPPLPALAELSELPAPEPQRVPDDKAIEHNPGPTFEVVDLEGQVYTFHDDKTAAAALGKLYADAAKRGSAFLDGAIETNSATHSQLEELGAQIAMPPEEPAKAPGEPEAKTADKAEKPHSAPPPGNAGPPFSGDHPSAVIPVPGNNDYRTWALGLFLPRVRQMNTSTDLAMLLGDNEKNLEDARRKLSAGDIRELENEITARWDEIGAIEKQPA